MIPGPTEINSTINSLIFSLCPAVVFRKGRWYWLRNNLLIQQWLKVEQVKSEKFCLKAKVFHISQAAISLRYLRLYLLVGALEFG